MTDNARIDEGKLIERLQVFADNLTRGSDWTGALLAAYNPTGSTAIPYERARAFLASDIVDALVRRSIQEQPDWPTERVCIPDPKNSDARIVGFRIREGDEAWGELGLSEPLFWLDRMLVASAPLPIAGAGWEPTEALPKEGQHEAWRDRARSFGADVNETPFGTVTTFRYLDQLIAFAASPVPDNTDARVAQASVRDVVLNEHAMFRVIEDHLRLFPNMLKNEGIHALYAIINTYLAAIIPGKDASGVIEQLRATLAGPWKLEYENTIEQPDGCSISFASTEHRKAFMALIRALDPVKAPKP